LTINRNDLEFLLSHFEPPAFPRRISTALSQNKQYVVYSIEEMLSEFERADEIDCKVNAYNYIGTTKTTTLPPSPNNENGNGNGKHNNVNDSAITVTTTTTTTNNIEDIAKRIQAKARAETAPTVIFIDLDNRKALRHTRKRIKDVFVDDNLEPTVIDSGNGYHIVLPLEIDPLKYSSSIPMRDTEKWQDRLLPGRNLNHAALIASTCYSNSGKYYVIPEAISPANMLLRFAEDFLTNNKADMGHNPSIRSCMVRVPGSHNSKRIMNSLESEVKIVNRWDGQKKAHILFLINRFYAHLQEVKVKRLRMILQARERRRRMERTTQFLNNINNNTFIIDEKGGVSRQLVDGTILNPADTDKWLAEIASKNHWYIELLLQVPINDFRKRAVNLMFAPYLVNLRGMSFEAAENVIGNWLARCNTIRTLDFDPEYVIKQALMYAKDRHYLPLGVAKFKEQAPELFSRLQANDKLRKGN
jgi:hypothetical protein